jgi:hypothetical protein
MVGKIGLIGPAAALASAPVAAPAQTKPSAAPAAANAVSIPNRATVRSGGLDTQQGHGEVGRAQGSRAPQEHSQQTEIKGYRRTRAPAPLRAAPNK